MTTITAKVVKATRHPNGGKPLYTLQLRYPLIIHGEFLTHRMFSRNSSSNRAIPVAKMIDDVITDPFVPIEWGKNQAGMVALDIVMEDYKCEQEWLNARDNAVETANRLVKLGLHKQVINRILMPFQHIDTLVTATEWDNFFKLRLQSDVEPHMKRLAFEIGVAIDEARLTDGQCRHLPFIPEGAYLIQNFHKRELISAARSARVTYRSTSDDVNKDIALANRLIADKHMSPLEHPAIPGDANKMYYNLKGWKSFRYRLEND
jgi:thymidylate synthase ThyX